MKFAFRVTLLVAVWVCIFYLAFHTPNAEQTTVALLAYIFSALFAVTES